MSDEMAQTTCAATPKSDGGLMSERSHSFIRIRVPSVVREARATGEPS